MSATNVAAAAAAAATAATALLLLQLLLQVTRDLSLFNIVFNSDHLIRYIKVGTGPQCNSVHLVDKR